MKEVDNVFEDLVGQINPTPHITPQQLLSMFTGFHFAEEYDVTEEVGILADRLNAFFAGDK